MQHNLVEKNHDWQWLFEAPLKEMSLTLIIEYSFYLLDQLKLGAISLEKANQTIELKRLENIATFSFCHTLSLAKIHFIFRSKNGVYYLTNIMTHGLDFILNNLRKHFFKSEDVV